MFLTIRNDQNLSVTVLRDGVPDRRMFTKGVHEIDEAEAEVVEGMNLRWVRVTVNRPVVDVDGNADKGPLTKDQVELGKDGAENKSFKEIFEEREAAAERARLAAEPVPDPAANFACSACTDAFPSVPALERHVEMNHATPVDPDDESQGEVSSVTPITGLVLTGDAALADPPTVVPPVRVRTGGDGLGPLRKGESYTKAPAAE